MSSGKKKSLRDHIEDNPLMRIAREYPIHLDDLPGDKVVVVATRAPKKPLSGGMAPAVKEACKDFQYKFWYAFGETEAESWFKRVVHGAFDGLHAKSVPIIAMNVEGFRVRQVKAEEKQWDWQYNQFCNRWVWPICHNLPKYAKELAGVDMYGNRDANERLAKRISQDLNGDEKTPIWIHDYHHLRLAQHLRRHGVKNPIVYFHHIPLPKVETLDNCHLREKGEFMSMLEAVMACDAVVFQTEETVQRFYALMGLDVPESIPAYEDILIDSPNNGREHGKVIIAHAPISINTGKVIETASQRHLETVIAEELDARLVAENIFINFERCDYSKGIEQRVKAFRELLERRPDLRGKTQLVLGAEPTRSDIPEYREYAVNVRQLTEAICSDKSLWIGEQPPVIFVNQNVVWNDVIRLMRNRKEGQRRIGLVTPYEDGMNLTAKEFAAAQDLNNAGPLVLSSGAGTAKELYLEGRGALVYPTFTNGDVEQLVHAMIRAVDMPQNEANERASVMQAHLKEFHIQRWAVFHRNLFEKINQQTGIPATFQPSHSENAEFPAEIQLPEPKLAIG